VLTHGAYAAIGGVKRAIATRAEAELEKLTPEQREALRRVMIRLVTRTVKILERTISLTFTA
jgi:hypothetical protein